MVISVLFVCLGLFYSVGDVEIQITNGEEVSIQQHACLKHPGHKEFIPYESFSRQHLQKKYRGDTFTCIKTIARLTVCLETNHVSKERPERCPIGNEPYPLSDYRGSKCSRTGSGWIEHVEAFHEKKTTNASQRNSEQYRCPCVDCSHSKQRECNWGLVHVVTANHMCFDDEEVRHTKCQLFYDSATKRNSIVIKGFKVTSALPQMTQDPTVFSCVTHDLKLADDLRKLCVKRDKLLEELVVKHNATSRVGALTVIVSHPHGCSKQISIGECVGYEEDRHLSRYTYTTPTCQGSSGGPVFILGRKPYWSSQCHSRRCQEEGFNMSGFCSEGRKLTELLLTADCTNQK